MKTADTETLVKQTLASLEAMKARDAVTLDVRAKTSIADFICIATSTSGRHARGIATRVIDDAKHSGVRPLGVEGLEQAEWILVDLGDVVVHIMQSETRSFYDLEQLWETSLSTAKEEV